jgi:3-oxoacyl-(acyl-carrier-protein) synthase
MTERVPAVTGVGLISSLASSLEGHWQGMLQLATGIRQVAKDDVPRALRYAGQVRDDALPADTPAEVLKQGRLISPSSRLGLRAVDEAVRRSGLDMLQIPPARRALYIGAADYSKDDYRDFYPAFREAGVSAGGAIDAEHINRATLHTVDPFFLLESLTNNLVAFVSRRYQLQGPNTTLASQSPAVPKRWTSPAVACSRTRTDVAIVVGACVWSRLVSLFDLDALGLLSQCRDKVDILQTLRRTEGWLHCRRRGGRARPWSHSDGHARAALALGCVWRPSQLHGRERYRKPGVSVETTRRAMAAALEEAGVRPERDRLHFASWKRHAKGGIGSELSAILGARTVTAP